MSKHPYYQLVAALRKQRNNMIADFRHFKRDRVNRHWMPHSAFSHTVTRFRQKIAEVDKVIAGAKLALRVSRETGVQYFYDYENNRIYFELP
jgi:hypothetical protein